MQIGSSVSNFPFDTIGTELQAQLGDPAGIDINAPVIFDDFGLYLERFQAVRFISYKSLREVGGCLLCQVIDDLLAVDRLKCIVPITIRNVAPMLLRCEDAEFPK